MRVYVNKIADELRKNNFKVSKMHDRGLVVQINHRLWVDLEYIGEGAFTLTQLMSKLSYDSEDIMLCNGGSDVIPITLLLSKCNIKFHKHYHN